MNKKDELKEYIDLLYNLYLFLFYKYKYRSFDLKELNNNIQFKNIHQGEKCFILGNGPSLREQNLKLLKDQYVFTVNQASRMDDYIELNTNYHIIADPIFFKLDNKVEEDREVIEYLKRINTNFNKPTCFFPLSAKTFFKDNHLDDELNINFFIDGYTLSHKRTLKNDFTKVIPGFYTVVQYAIWLAIYMGFKEIYLLGCDMTGYKNIELRMNEQNSSNQYVYNLSQNEKARIKRDHIKQSNESMFFGFAKMFHDYRLLNDYCNSKDVKLVNLTKGGILDNIDRREYSNVINHNNFK